MSAGDLSNFFDAFYTRFILRDVLAKIVPGAMFILVAALSHYPAAIVFAFFEKLSAPGWIFVSGIAWLTAFAFQSLGEIPLCHGWRAIRYYPRYVTKALYEQRSRRFRSRSNFGRNEVDLERLVIIQEATGNAYVILSAALVYAVVATIVVRCLICNWGCTYWSVVWHENRYDAVVFLVLILMIIFFLARAHRMHIKRQWRLLENRHL